MKSFKIVLKIAIVLFGYNLSTLNAIEISDEILREISFIESRHRDNVIGDNGKAFGRYQIHKSYLQDANRIMGTNYSHSDMFNPEISKKVVIAYLSHYGKRYERITKKKINREILLRIHNGGLNGWRKKSTDRYITTSRIQHHTI